MDCSGKGSLKMKTKLFCSLLLLAVAAAPGALAAADEGENNSHIGRKQSSGTPVEEPAITSVPTGRTVQANDPKQSLQDYDSLMIALTQKFSVTLATITEAVKRGEVSSEQAREMSAEQYQLAHMQFELLSLWRGIEEQDSARSPDVQVDPAPREENEVVTVGLPFSSPQLNPSLATYLNLTPTQVEAIQQVMTREQSSFEPLITELRVTRDKLLAIASEHINEKQIKALADTEAGVLARLIIANACMQSKIYKILSPDQQKKLSDLERTQGAVTSDSK
jgi:Spy/CpxP family protein refolding chaperone